MKETTDHHRCCCCCCCYSQMKTRLNEVRFAEVVVEIAVVVVAVAVGSKTRLVAVDFQ